MRKVALFSVIFMAGLIAGCGPDQRADDASNEESKDRYEKTADDLTPILGRYHGTWTSRMNVEHDAEVVIYRGSTSIPGAGGKPLEVPLVQGNLAVAYGEQKPQPFAELVQMKMTGNVVSFYIQFRRGPKENELGYGWWYSGIFANNELNGIFRVEGDENKLELKKVTSESRK